MIPGVGSLRRKRSAVRNGWMTSEEQALFLLYFSASIFLTQTMPAPEGKLSEKLGQKNVLMIWADENKEFINLKVVASMPLIRFTIGKFATPQRRRSSS
jgi:hypothetical protein